MTNPELEARFDEIGMHCIAYSGLGRAIAVMRDTDDPLAADALIDRQRSVVGTIETLIRSYPGMLLQLEQHETQGIVKASQSIGIVHEKLGPEERQETSHYREGLYEDILRSSQVLNGLAALRTDESANDKIKRGFDHRSFSGEMAPGTVIEIDAEDHIYIDDQELQLTPLQKIIIDKLLDADDVVTYKDIYTDSEFVELIKDAKAAPVIQLTNNIRGIRKKSEKLGLHREAIIADAGPKSSGLLRINPNTDVVDQKALANAGNLASYFIDFSELGEAFNPDILACSYFGRSNVGVRYAKVVRSALTELETRLANSNLAIVHSADGAVTIEVKPGIPTAEITAMDRGKLTDFDVHKVQFETGTVTLSEDQACMMSILLSDRQRGASRAHIQNTLREGGFNTSQFDIEFDGLRKLLGDNLARHISAGKTRYVLKAVRK